LTTCSVVSGVVGGLSAARDSDAGGGRSVDTSSCISVERVGIVAVGIRISDISNESRWKRWLRVLATLLNAISVSKYKQKYHWCCKVLHLLQPKKPNFHCMW
jgi:hypothetical protein